MLDEKLDLNQRQMEVSLRASRKIKKMLNKFYIPYIDFLKGANKKPILIRGNYNFQEHLKFMNEFEDIFIKLKYLSIVAVLDC